MPIFAESAMFSFSSISRKPRVVERNRRYFETRHTPVIIVMTVMCAIVYFVCIDVPGSFGGKKEREHFWREFFLSGKKSGIFFGGEKNGVPIQLI